VNIIYSLYNKYYYDTFLKDNKLEQKKEIKMKPNIEVVIPYYEGNLGKAYNQAMKKVDDWALMLDNDILILTPNWYPMLQEAISYLGHSAGWITCKTNSIWCDDQLDMSAPQSGNIIDHMLYAKSIAKDGDPQIAESSPYPYKFLGNIFSGFFILTHKEAWKDAGGFIEDNAEVSHFGHNFRCNKHLGVDNDFFFRIKKAGYTTHVITNMYAFHLRELKYFAGTK
jgi:GT2 family glycosyltransferase